VVLGRVDVARGPAHVSAERLQRLDEDSSLDGHVQRAGDPCAAQRLLRRELFANGHEAGHLSLGNLDFLATPVSKVQVGDFVVSKAGRLAYGAHLAPSFLNFKKKVCERR
jgi:hypothetical protein